MGDRGARRQTRTLSPAKPRPISTQVEGSGVAKLSCDRSSDTLNDTLGSPVAANVIASANQTPGGSGCGLKDTQSRIAPGPEKVSVTSNV